jgi:tRNA(Arg) A34 adenosine deaminase TadA
MTNPSIFVYDYETIKKTKTDLNEEVIAKALHPKTTVVGGVLEQECSQLMQDFFKSKR